MSDISISTAGLVFDADMHLINLAGLNHKR